MLASVKLISPERPPTHPPPSFLLFWPKTRVFAAAVAVKFQEKQHSVTRVADISIDNTMVAREIELTSCLCYFIPVSVIGSTAGKAEIRFRWDHSCHGFKNWSTSVLLLLAAAAAERTAAGKEERGEGSRADNSQPYAWDSSLMISTPKCLYLTKQVKACGWHPQRSLFSDHLLLA